MLWHQTVFTLLSWARLGTRLKFKFTIVCSNVFLIHQLLAFPEIRCYVLPRIMHDRFLYNCFVVCLRHYSLKFFYQSLFIFIRQCSLSKQWDMHFLGVYKAYYSVFQLCTNKNLLGKPISKSIKSSLCPVFKKLAIEPVHQYGTGCV